MAPPHRTHTHIPPHRGDYASRSPINGLSLRPPRRHLSCLCPHRPGCHREHPLNAIANTIFTATALDIFKEARTAAHVLQVINRNTPTFNPTFRTYRHFEQAVDTRDPQFKGSPPTSPGRRQMNPNDPLVPKIEFGEVGDDNRVTVTIDLVPLSSTYDVP